MEAYLGTIMHWPTNWAPQGWALCDGSLLPIQGNEALYSLLGTTWGGDGQSSFGVPDLRGRAPVGAGQGPNLTNRVFGQTFGAESVVLNTANLPGHTHMLTASNTASSLTQNPAQGWTLGAAVAIPSGGGSTPVQIYGGPSPVGPIASAPTSAAGNPSPAPVPTLPPTVCTNFIICTEGDYPPRP